MPLPAGTGAVTTRPGLLLESRRNVSGEPSSPVHRVAATPGTTLRPPGLPSLPAPGELVVSPALRVALAGDPLLRARVPGTVVGTLGPQAVAAPRQLVAWTGATVEALAGRGVGLTTGFQAAASTDLVVPSSVRVGAPFMVLAFLVPLVALFAVVASSGGTPASGGSPPCGCAGCAAGEATVLAVVEAPCSGLASGVTGLLLFDVAAPRLAPSVPLGDGAWPDQVRVVGWAAALALAGVPLLAGAVVAHQSRRAVLDPLAGHQATPLEAPVGRSGALSLLVGVAALVAVEPVRRAAGVDPAVTVLGAALLVLLVGVLLGTRWVVARVGGWAAGASRAVPVLVAGRYVARHPRSSARVATGVSLLVLFAGVLLAFFPLLSDADAEQAARVEQVVGSDTLRARVPARVAPPTVVAGADAVVQLRTREDDDGRRWSWVSCAGLARLLDRPTCTGPGATEALDRLREDQVLPVDVDPLVNGRPPARRPTQVLLLVRPAADADVEAVRTALVAAGVVDVVTAGEVLAERRLDTVVFREATLVALGCAGLVALGSLLAGLADHVVRQRRGFAMLGVIGVTRAQLGRVPAPADRPRVAPGVLLGWVAGLGAAGSSSG